MSIEIQGELFAIRLAPGASSSGIVATLLVEDDGFWHKKTDFDALWLADLASIAEKARATFEANTPRKPEETAR